MRICLSPDLKLPWTPGNFQTGMKTTAEKYATRSITWIARRVLDSYCMQRRMMISEKELTANIELILDPSCLSFRKKRNPPRKIVYALPQEKISLSIWSLPSFYSTYRSRKRFTSKNKLRMISNAKGFLRIDVSIAIKKKKLCDFCFFIPRNSKSKRERFLKKY